MPIYPDEEGPSPFAPNQGFEQIPNPTPEQQGGLMQQWKQTLADPAARAAIMQFGLQLSQPTALGQNRLGHIGQAVGAGGEAAARVQANERADVEQARKGQETDSRVDSRIAAANVAEARANTASTVAAAQQDRLSAQRDRDASGALIRAQGLFQKEVSDIRKKNDNAQLMGGIQEKIPTWEEWLARNPMLQQQLGTSAPNAQPFSVTPDPNGPAPSQAPAADQRVVGETYQTPRGPLIWMGNGKWKMP